MKRLAILLALGFWNAASGAEEKAYAVVQNTSDFPLPYELPSLGEADAAKFDWKKYLDASKSKSDRAFRARVAGMDYGQVVPDGGDSNVEQANRGNLAADEFKAKCDELIRRYRLKLKATPDVLKDLENYVALSEEAISLQVKLVGGSWGGSGARAAYTESRMKAYLNFHRNLEALGESLHLQDLPE